MSAQTRNQHAMQDPTTQYPRRAELAPVYVLLASQEASFATGEVYGVTGGNHLP